MKNYRVVYLPTGGSNKQWCFFEAVSETDVQKYFNRGTIISIEETNEPFEEI